MAGESLRASEEFRPPVESMEGFRPFLYRIPAPRGLIVDRDGNALAGNRARKRLVIQLQRFAGTAVGAAEVEMLTCRLQEWFARVEPLCSTAVLPDRETLAKHWEHRPFFPLPISGFVREEEIEPLRSLIEKESGRLAFQDTYERIYPAGRSCAHIVGYTGEVAPDQHGPLAHEEPLWQRAVGRDGLEKRFDDVLRGEDGMLSVVYREKDGKEVFRRIARPPRPGKTLVTALNLEMQKHCAALLAKSGRNGAFVVLDAGTGDILAAASHPTFDPGEFVAGISEKRFEALREEPDAPLFNRALSGEYPPGSTFKPVVALAGLSSRRISPGTRYDGPPSMAIEGRTFRNWNSSHEGILDVRYALTRSCNTWFYQAAMDIGGEPILTAARSLGFGSPPTLWWDGVSGGNLPSRVQGKGALANLSIGQGEVLASPLQVAVSMTPFANGGSVALPRLCLQTQEPLTHEPLQVREAERRTLPCSRSHLTAIKEGLWGVVNHGRGTATGARHHRLTIYGKTGTSQWQNRGKEHRLAWFAGFVGAEDPRLAFAVLSEGRRGESVSGGRVAAPIADRFISDVYRKPELFAVAVPENPERMRPSLGSERPRYSSPIPTRRGLFPNLRRFFSFGRGR